MGAFLFRDRDDAGIRLGERLVSQLGRHAQPLVLGIPRGGLVVAYRVWEALGGDLRPLVVTKIRAPNNPEYAWGALADGLQVLNDELDPHDPRVQQALHVAVREHETRTALFGGAGPLPPLVDRLVIVVDDGIATGFSMRAGAEALRRAGCRTLGIAVPVAPAGAVPLLRTVADWVTVLEAPAHFLAVGEWYQDFAPVADDTVVRLLAQTGAGDDLQ